MAQTVTVACGFGGEAGDLYAEGCWLGVDAVCAADAERVHVGAGERGECLCQLFRPGQHNRADITELHGERGVEHVARSESVVNPAACRLAGTGGKNIDEGRDVVVENLLAFGDLLGRCRRAADRLKIGLGRAVKLLASGYLNAPPRLKAGGIGPQRANLVARVAIDHARRILSARWPAFFALSRPTAATGTPGGI
ncbi:unannotated protein [freshwater metagenome]|uniref:Unannotated protein n=1 Tax=freshwater metagenome TaxID=449393 RepID=A0A6J7RW13_9ZZZZ